MDNMYSMLGDQIMIGKVVRRVEDESSNNVVLKIDFGFQRKLKPNVKYGWNSRSQYVVLNTSQPVIIEGPIEFKVIRKDAVCDIKQVILCAVSKRKIYNATVEEADALDYELAKRVIKVSSDAMRKREALLASKYRRSR